MNEKQAQQLSSLSMTLAQTTNQITQKCIEKETVDSELTSLHSKRELIERQIENVYHTANEQDAMKFRESQQAMKTPGVQEALANTAENIASRAGNKDENNNNGNNKNLKSEKKPEEAVK